MVQSAISVSYGDNYKGYRILGTELGYFDYYQGELSKGELFSKSFEIVAGSAVAEKLGLQLGSTFFGAHGLAANSQHIHDDKSYTVVGILKSSGNVLDNLLICNLESVWDAHNHDDHDHETHEGEERMHTHSEHEHDDHEGHQHEHDAEEHHHDHDEDLEITSLLVKFKSPLGLVQMPRFINENTNMQAALPGFEIKRLIGLLGAGVKTINGIAFAILLVSGFSIFISIVKTIRERRQELALLRTYGLGTNRLILLVVLEGIFLAIIGFVLGWILGRLGLFFGSSYFEGEYGYKLAINAPTITELWLFLATVIIAVIAVLLASSSIFKLNVAKVLSNE